MKGRQPAPPIDNSKPVISLPVRVFRAHMKDAASHGKPIVLGDHYKCFALVIPMNCSLDYQRVADKAACKKARALFATVIASLEGQK
jgi:hypothetical protein